MNSTTITVVKDFHPKPFGRFESDYFWCGEKFRKMLNLHLNENDHVLVDLNGYNRYGPSFIDEAFGKLVSKCNWSVDMLKYKLTIKHDVFKRFEIMAWECIEKNSK